MLPAHVDRRALARALTALENAPERVVARRPRRDVEPGAPHVVGITGPPGAGKSTLVARLVAGFRSKGETVAVLAVDPSSPFGGGALLGDRLRMEEHALDPGVFIRSVASRGSVGGLSRAVSPMVDELDAAGFDVVLVETVGVGQSELAVMEVADTVIVVLTPESGDTVQAMKAGLVEVADIFVVNKADRPGAELLARELEESVAMAFELHPDAHGWAIPVHTARAIDAVGIDALVEVCLRHRAHCVGEGRAWWLARRAEGRIACFLDLLAEHERRAAALALGGARQDLAQQLRSGVLGPVEALASWLMRKVVT